MTARTSRTRPETTDREAGRGPLSLPEGALLGVGVEASWTDDIPPVPAGRTVTVSVSSARVADRDGPALRALGYRVVGVGADPAADRTGAALFLVRQDVAAAHPTWWRALADRAERVHNLAHGPVAAVFAAALRRHVEALADAG